MWQSLALLCLIPCSSGNKKQNLQQNDVTDHHVPSPLCPFTPTPNFRVSVEPPGLQLASLSLLGTRIHYREELPYCEDPVAPSCRRGWCLATWTLGHDAMTRLQRSHHPLITHSLFGKALHVQDRLTTTVRANLLILFLMLSFLHIKLM